jgi:hypothetical protein
MSSLIILVVVPILILALAFWGFAASGRGHR